MIFPYNSLEEETELPHNLIIERIIIAEILLNKSTTNLIFYKVKKDFFYSSKHRQIFEAAKEIYEKDSKVNIDIVADYLQMKKKLNKIGGIKNLVEIINRSSSSSDIEIYIVLLFDKYIRRQIIKASASIKKLAYQSFDSIETLFDEAEKILLSITQEKESGNLLLTSEVLLEIFLDLENRSLNGANSGTKSGFFDLDLMTQGFQKSDLIIIAGRPSMGKTAFALNLVRNIAEKQKKPIIVFSLEMSRQQIIYRFLSMESQVPHTQLRNGYIGQKEWYLITRAISILSNLSIFLDDTPNLSLISIRSKVNNLKIQYGSIGMIILDYLQLLGEESSKESRVQELSRLTRGLKILAKEFESPLIVLSQLSRNVESRVNKRPLLSDLRESGCVSGDTRIYIASKNNYYQLNKCLEEKRRVETLALSRTKHIFTSQVIMVKRLICTGSKLLYKMKTLEENTLKVTESHRVMTLKGWIRLRNISNKDLVLLMDIRNHPKLFFFNVKKIINYSSFCFLSVVDIDFCKEDLCYDLWVPKLNNYIANGSCIHNSIEQDADLVLMLYRDSYYDSNLHDDNTTEIIITKHRNGPVGTLNLTFDPSTLTFSNLIF